MRHILICLQLNVQEILANFTVKVLTIQNGESAWTYSMSRCGPCKMIAPHLEEMDKTMDDVVFLKVDVDECEDLAQEYKVIFIFVCRLNVNITKYTLVDA